MSRLFVLAIPQNVIFGQLDEMLPDGFDTIWYAQSVTGPDGPMIEFGFVNLEEHEASLADAAPARVTVPPESLN